MGHPSLLVVSQSEGFAFGGVVAIPFGDFDYVVTGLGDDGLAAQTRGKLLIGSHVEAVELIVVGLADSLSWSLINQMWQVVQAQEPPQA